MCPLGPTVCNPVLPSNVSGFIDTVSEVIILLYVYYYLLLSGDVVVIVVQSD